jgi:drug/metabolite transporter (DMT)-like permease
VADLSLLALTLLWGTTFLVVNRVLIGTTPGAFLTLRFVLATCVMGVVWLVRGDRRTPGLLRDGALIGGSMLVGFALQTEGLRLTTPARSAFLTSMSVLFVPVIERLIYRRRLPGAAWLGAALAVVGLAILSGATTDAGMRRGDLLTLGASIAFAQQILWTAERSARHRLVPLTTVELAIVTLGAAVLLLAEPARCTASPAFILALLYTGIVMTSGAFLVQNWGQRYTTPTRAALIFALEPVFAALFSSWLGGERLGVSLLVGGALIVGGVVVSEVARA